MIDIFIAYSHNDLHHKDELKKFLRPLLREGRISLWDDFDIEAGQDWDAKIKERLYGADLVLLLVSSDSLASDYFYGKEVTVSLERHARGESIVVPVILRHCDWAETPLGSLEALPEKGRPVVEWPTRDQAFQDVVSRLRRVVEGLEQRRQKESAQAESLHKFNAACLAADHLFQKKNWVEAKNAYSSALAVYLPGFAPAAAALQAKIADCDTNIRSEQAAAHQAKSAADKQAKEAEAQQQRLEKERLAQEQRERADAAKRQAAEAAAARRYQHSDTPAANSSPRYGLLVGIGVVALVLLLFWWKPWAKTASPAQETTTKTTEKPTNDPVKDAFEQAEAAGTLTALEAFRQQNPASAFDGRVQQLIGALQQKRKKALDAADIYLEEKDWENARTKLRAALAISPQDADILKKLKRIEGK